MSKLLVVVAFLATTVLWAVPGALATHGGSTEVTVGSPDTPFPQNKQNEPAVAINPIAPNIVAAGANDEIDIEGCNVAADNTCPFTTGVGTSGIAFSIDSGDHWVQPTYTGFTTRDCLGVAGTSTDTCAGHVGPIGTLPRYFENGLVSDGDPAVGFGPKPGPDGTFSWSNGWRLYYANLSANFSAERSEATFKGFEAIAVSRLDDDDFGDALNGDSTAWQDPVIVTKQNAALFSDHEMVAVDDAASSPFFGNVYICDAAFRGQEKGNAAPDPIVLNSSSDGGQTWAQTQLSAATNNGQGLGRQDCQVNTDSHGTVYVFWQGGDPRTRQDTIFMARSSDGGKHFERPPLAVTTFDGCGIVDPAGELAFDGVAGARDGSFPSIDIANGAPTGANAPDTIVMTWCDGPTPTSTSPGPIVNEQAIVQYSTNRGTTWTRIGNGADAGDRPDFPAVAISPDGRDVYLVYMAFLQPWQTTTANPRLMQGVVRHADFAGAGTSFTTLHRGPTGDARGSSANSLTGEFLGDYNYAFATNDYAVATWNDVRNAADCPAVDTYRQSLMTETTADDVPAPAPATDCPPPTPTSVFGNSDIFGGSYGDPSSP